MYGALSFLGRLGNFGNIETFAISRSIGLAKGLNHGIQRLCARQDFRHVRFLRGVGVSKQRVTF